jgi:hypothetical protein
VLRNYVTFCLKQRNYGAGNIAPDGVENEPGVRFAITGLFFRINDKLQRIKNMIFTEHEDAVGESELRTWKDLSVYGIIAQLVHSRKWGK